MQIARLYECECMDRPYDLWTLLFFLLLIIISFFAPGTISCMFFSNIKITVKHILRTNLKPQLDSESFLSLCFDWNPTIQTSYLYKDASYQG